MVRLSNYHQSIGVGGVHNVPGRPAQTDPPAIAQYPAVRQFQLCTIKCAWSPSVPHLGRRSTSVLLPAALNGILREERLVSYEVDARIFQGAWSRMSCPCAWSTALVRPRVDLNQGGRPYAPCRLRDRILHQFAIHPVLTVTVLMG